MKGILAVASLLITGVVSQGPYAPSGWRPNGPTLELPERTPVDPRNRTPQKQEYLPPNDPRIPNREYGTPTKEYGTPEVDVSVQGLPPTQEQLPIFQLSPVNGQQYAGPAFNNDLRNLEQNLRQSQLQAQQDIYREFARQRQLEAALANANANRVNRPVPRQFAPRTTTTTPKPDDFKTTPQETTTEALSLNQGEVANDSDKKEKVTVEVSKQNIQEFSPELYLASLAQLQLQNQFSPVQLGQLRAPIFLEPAQKQVAYDPAQVPIVPVLNQQQYQYPSQIAAQPQYVQQPQLIQPQAVPTQQAAQTPSYFITQAAQPEQLPVNQYQPNQYQPNQYQPNQYEAVQPVQTFPQQPQPSFLQPQQNQLLPRPQDQPSEEPQQPQLVYQYQFGYQQPASQYQAELQQPLNSYQQQLFQPQLIVQDPYQQQLAAQIAQQQSQDSLQSGLDANQQGNGIDQAEEKEEREDDGATATAVATAFGARTQPRVYATYGAPAPVPRVQATPGYQTTTEANDEAVTDDGQAIAEATAVSRGSPRKSAKLRSRQSRVRPIFTLDKSGHLVLSQDQ